MFQWVRSTAVGLVAAGTSAAQSFAVGDFVDAATLHVLIAGMGAGLAGGIAAALMSWGDRSWGVREGLKTILLGFILGPFVALGLSDYKLIGAGTRWVLVFCLGFLAAEVLRKLREVGVATILDWLRRRERPSPAATSNQEPKP